MEEVLSPVTVAVLRALTRRRNWNAVIPLNVRPRSGVRWMGRNKYRTNVGFSPWRTHTVREALENLYADGLWPWNPAETENSARDLFGRPGPWPRAAGTAVPVRWACTGCRAALDFELFRRLRGGKSKSVRFCEKCGRRGFHSEPQNLAEVFSWIAEGVERLRATVAAYTETPYGGPLMLETIPLHRWNAARNGNLYRPPAQDDPANLYDHLAARDVLWKGYGLVGVAEWSRGQEVL